MAAWVLGAVINLIGSVFVNLGTNVMKLGHNKRAALNLPEAEKPAIKKFKEWQMGVGMFILGNIFNFVSFGYAAQSLLAALGSIQFVSNVFFSSLVLKEEITLAVIISTALIVGGCTLLVAFGNHSSHEYDMHQLLALYARPAYITYLVVMVACVIGAYYLYMYGKKMVSLDAEKAGIWVSILPVAYAVFSALFGTQSVLFSKTLSVLLRATFSGNNQLNKWFTWVVIPMFLCSSAFWVTRLNKGLRLFPAMVIVPTMQIAWTLFAIVSGMLYFEEYRGFNGLSAAMFLLGVMVVFLGVALLTRSQASRLAQQQRQHQQEVAIKAEQQVENEHGMQDKISASRHQELELQQGQAVGRRSFGESQQSYAELPIAHSPDLARQSQESSYFEPASPRESSSSVKAAGKIKRMAQTLQRDFSLDNSTAARLSLGFGDSVMPALSVFGPPAVDLMTSREYCGMHTFSEQWQREAASSSNGSSAFAFSSAKEDLFGEMLSPRQAAAAAVGSIKESVGSIKTSAASALKMLTSNPKQLLQHKHRRYQNLRRGSSDFAENDNGLFDVEEGGEDDEDDEVFGSGYTGGRDGRVSLMPDTMERSAAL